jgi:hypothetical protein
LFFDFFIGEYMRVGQKDITIDDCWLLEIARIPDELREPESRLMQSRWFDYRHLLPGQATQVFADRFEEIYVETYAKWRDYRTAESVQIFDAEVFASPDLLSCWSARQAADEIGCDYDFYIRQAFKRAWDRGWRFIPRPNQLYNDALTADLGEVWKEECRYVLKLAKHERYKLDAYEGHPDQDAYHHFLLEQVAQREQKHMVLGRLLYKENCLPEKLAIERFGRELVDKARGFYR